MRVLPLFFCLRTRLSCTKEFIASCTHNGNTYRLTMLRHLPFCLILLSEYFCKVSFRKTNPVFTSCVLFGPSKAFMKIGPNTKIVYDNTMKD